MRAAGIPVVMVADPLAPGEKAHDFGAHTVRKGEKVFTKEEESAFSNPRFSRFMEEWRQKTGDRDGNRLIIAGTSTDDDIRKTVKDALARHFKVLVVEDAVTDHDRPTARTLRNIQAEGARVAPSLAVNKALRLPKP